MSQIIDTYKGKNSEAFALAWSHYKRYVDNNAKPPSWQKTMGYLMANNSRVPPGTLRRWLRVYGWAYLEEAVANLEIVPEPDTSRMLLGSDLLLKLYNGIVGYLKMVFHRR